MPQAWSRLIASIAVCSAVHELIARSNSSWCAKREAAVAFAERVEAGPGDFSRGEQHVEVARIVRLDPARQDVGLGHRFEHIQIEGEFGQGKPELAVYRHALERLDCAAADAWMVGDNYEWEVVAPQKLGMCGIWYDPFETGIPAGATHTPTRIIRRLGELLED